MKLTSDNEKLIFDALTRANISFMDGARDNDAARVDFILGDPASGVHIDVVEAGETNRRDCITVCGDRAAAFMAMLLNQRAEIVRLRRAVEEAEIMYLVSADRPMRAVEDVS